MHLSVYLEELLELREMDLDGGDRDLDLDLEDDDDLEDAPGDVFLDSLMSPPSVDDEEALFRGRVVVTRHSGVIGSVAAS